MKNKLAYIVFVLVSALSVTSTYALTEKFVFRKQLPHYVTPSTSICSHSNVATGKIIRYDQGNHNRSESSSDGTQIRQAPDATMNASVAPATQTLLALIAVLHLYVHGDNPPIGNSPPQTPRDKILFRVIISPNAP